MGPNPRPEQIPDRVSSIPGDPNFFMWWPKVGVKVDGRVSFNVMEFCVSERWVKFCQRGRNNRIVRERGRPMLVRKDNVDVEPYWR